MKGKESERGGYYSSDNNQLFAVFVLLFFFTISHTFACMKIQRVESACLPSPVAPVLAKFCQTNYLHYFVLSFYAMFTRRVKKRVGI